MKQLSINWQTIAREDLEDLMAEVAEDSGLEAAQFLVERFGGMTLYVTKLPARYDDVSELGRSDINEWMAEVADYHSLGLVRTLIRRRGGEMVYIPVLSKLLDAVRERRIQREYDGTNAGDLAMRYRISRRKVLRMTRRRHQETEESS